MCAPSPPAAPDYTKAAQQQGAENLKATKLSGQINNPNVVNPYGTQTTQWGTGFDQSGYDAAQKVWADAQQAYQTKFGTDFPEAYYQNRPGWHPPTREEFTKGDPNQPTLTQTFSPSQQALFDQSQATQLKLGQLAGQGAEALKGVVGTGVDFSGAPTTGSYDETRKRVIDAMMGRANEDYAKQTDAANSNLVAAGIRPGTKAYADNQQMIERSHNDARAQAEVAGGNAASQAYGMDEARRRQYITELLAKRQTPLNEITALMSGSQVSNPFNVPGYAQNAQVQPAPLYGATQDLGAWNTGLYNAQAAQVGNLQSGLFGLGGAALKGAGAAYGAK